MSLVKNICKDMIEKYKRDQVNNAKFDGQLSPILITMIPLKVCNIKIKNSTVMYNLVLSLMILLKSYVDLKSNKNNYIVVYLYIIINC